MATYYCDISNAYYNSDTVGAANNGTQANPWHYRQIRSLDKGGTENGITAADGDIFRIKGFLACDGVSTVPRSIFDNMTIGNLTFKAWEDNAPWGLTQVDQILYAELDSPATADIITTWEHAVFGIRCECQMGAGFITTNKYVFKNCVFYQHEARNGAGLSGVVEYYGCSFIRYNTELSGNIAGAPTAIETALYQDCYFEDCVPAPDAQWGLNGRPVTIIRCCFTQSEATLDASISAGTVLTKTGCEFDVNNSKTLSDQYGWETDDVKYFDYNLPILLGVESEWIAKGYNSGLWSDERTGYGAFDFDFSLAIDASPLSGVAPLKVEFTPNVINIGLVYSWNFGDGDESSESSPVHSYNMPGEYTVSLTVTDGSGNSFTATTTIYVRENDYSAGGRVVTKTNKCYRFAIPQEQITQGVGWTEYNGVKWPFPVGLVGCCKIMDENDEDIQLCVDGDTFYTYQLGKDDWWVDGGNEDYAGDDFEAEILLRENVNPIGATSRIKHSQSRADFKPWWKDQRKTGVYNAQGFRDAFSADLFVRKDSEPYNAAITKQIPRKGQVVFDRNMESEFLQMGLLVRGAPWRMTYAEQWYSSRDSGGNPELKEMSELSWALQATEPLVWIGRDSGLVVPTLPINYGTGLQVTGSYTALVTGPDDYANSAFAFGIADSFVAEDVPDAGENFSLMMWIRSPANPVVLWESSDGGLRVVLTTVGAGWKIEYTDNHNNFDIPLNDITGWVMLTLVRKDDALVAYQNSTLLNTYGLSPDTDSVYGDIEVCQGSCAAWGIRMVPGVLTAHAVEYFYNDVIENNGNATEAIF